MRTWLLWHSLFFELLGHVIELHWVLNKIFSSQWSLIFLIDGEFVMHVFSCAQVCLEVWVLSASIGVSRLRRPLRGWMDRSLPEPLSPLQWNSPTTRVRKPARLCFLSSISLQTGDTQDHSHSRLRDSGNIRNNLQEVRLRWWGQISGLYGCLIRWFS